MTVNSSGSQVIQLRPRLQPLEAAVRYYRDGRPSECLAALRGHVGRQAAILRTRTELRLGDAAAALAALPSLDDDCAERERGEALTLRGAALTCARRFEEATETLDLARVFAFGAGCAELEADFEFASAALHFATSRYDLAADAAARVLAVRQPLFPDPVRYFVPLAHTRARAYNACGAVAAAREDLTEQLLYVRRAVEEFALTAERDAWFWGSALMQLAFHVRDYDLVADADVLRREVAAFDWPADMARMQFEIYRALGWSSALQGDVLAAFRSFRLCLETAPSVAWKIIAFVDRASLGRELHEQHSAREEIEYAATLAERIDWNATGEERIGLAQLAAELAVFSPARAEAIMARYRGIVQATSPLALHPLSRRPRAYESMAEGAVAAALGNASFAAMHFETAFAIFDALGSQWLAARVALELTKLGAGERFAAYAKLVGTSRPGSWLARRTASMP